MFPNNDASGSDSDIGNAAPFPRDETDTDSSSDTEPVKIPRGFQGDTKGSPGWHFDARKYLVLDAEGLQVSSRIFSDFDEQAAGHAAKNAQEYAKGTPLICPKGFDRDTHVRSVEGGGFEADTQAIMDDGRLTHKQKIDVYRWARSYTPPVIRDDVTIAEMRAAVSNGITSASNAITNTVYTPAFRVTAIVLCAVGVTAAALAGVLVGSRNNPGTAEHFEIVHRNSTELASILEELRQRFPQITQSDNWSNVADWVHKLPENIQPQIPYNTTEGFVQNAWVRSLGNALEPTTALFLAATLLALQALFQS